MSTTERVKAIKWAALGGAAVPFVFLAGVLIAASQYDGYSHVTQKISELGGAEATSPWIQNLNFFLIGLLVLGLVWALSRVMGAPHRGVLLLGYFAVSAAIGNALLPCDAGCAGETTVGLLHILTGITGFVAAIGAMFVFTRRWQDDPDWQAHAAFTRIIRLVAIGGLVWFVVTQAADLEATAGIAQRVFAFALMVWIGATGWRLYRHVTASDRLATRVR